MISDNKHRKRRIASDEAHAWARNLRLGNLHAKAILVAYTLYVDGEGCCFVGMEQIAEDVELSTDTVRRRLVWLEQIGAIKRAPQWIDESGHRNGEGRGRRTTDLIRLLTEADPGEIEVNAQQAEKVGISPSRGPVARPSVSPPPTLALRQGAESSEPEPEEERGESARAREPLVSEAATQLAEQCMIALGLEPENPPIGWFGLAYDCEVLIKRGCDPPLVVAKFAEFRGTRKPKAYILKAVDTAHQNPSGPYAKTQRSRDGSGEPPANDWRSSRDEFRRARAALKASIAADEGREESG